MSEGQTPNEDLKTADDALFNGKDIPSDPDEIVTVEGDAVTGFETVVDEPKADEPAKEEPQAAQPAQADEFEGMPPAAIAAMKDERKKRQALEAKLEALENRTPVQIPQVQQPAQPQQPQIPNPAVDPQGYHDFMANQLQSQMLDARLDMSESDARRVHGHEAVNAALSAMQSRPDNQALAAQFNTQPHPWGAMVEWHKQQQLLSEIGSDPDAYKAKIIEDYLASNPGAQPPVAESPQPQTQTPNLPPRAGKAASVMPGGAAQHTMADAESNLWGR